MLGEQGAGVEVRRTMGVEVISFLEGWSACGCMTLLILAASTCRARESEEHTLADASAPSSPLQGPLLL